MYGLVLVEGPFFFYFPPPPFLSPSPLSPSPPLPLSPAVPLSPYRFHADSLELRTVEVVRAPCQLLKVNIGAAYDSM